MEKPEYMTASARIKFGARGTALFGYLPSFGRPRADRNRGSIKSASCARRPGSSAGSASPAPLTAAGPPCRRGKAERFGDNVQNLPEKASHGARLLCRRCSVQAGRLLDRLPLAQLGTHECQSCFAVLLQHALTATESFLSGQRAWDFPLFALSAERRSGIVRLAAFVHVRFI
jgi:hypothetical protein